MKNCNGDYPDWGKEQEYVNSDIEPIPAEICEGCNYINACRIRVTLLMNLGIETSDERLEEMRELIIEETELKSKRTIH